MLYQNFPMLMVAGIFGGIVGLLLTIDWAKRKQPMPPIAYNRWLSSLVLFSFLSLLYALVPLFFNNPLSLRSISVFIELVPALACFVFGLVPFLLARRIVVSKMAFFVAEFIYLVYLLLILWLWGDLFGRWANTTFSPFALNLDDTAQKFFLVFALVAWLTIACLIYLLVRLIVPEGIRSLIKTVRQIRNL